MLALIKELTDRFIEFILSLVKGDSLEAQLTSALKSAIFMVTVLICLVINLLITNMNQRVELKDMEDGISRINVLFDERSGGSIQGFLKANTQLSTQNARLNQDNMNLMAYGIGLRADSRSLKIQLLQIASENRLLVENNKALREALKYRVSFPQ